MENNMIADSVDCNVENKYKNLTSEDWRDDSHDKKCGTFRRHSSIDLESDIYDMNHENRGVAIIFDHYKFNSGKTPSPKQVKTDSKLLKETLQKLGFIVEVHSNCTKKEIKENLQRVADVDHQNNDCISIAVLSHGKAGRLEARDGSYAVNELWDILIETASLIGKPKLFFIQAYSDEIQKDSFVTTGSMVNYIKFPVVADLLVMSCEEHLGSLSRGKGSSFIQALCREFDDYGKTLEFLRLLARVNRKVSRFQSIESTNVASEDHSKSDCIAIIVLTHGGEGDLLAAKDGYYKVDIIYQAILNIPSLIGKPKLVFLQACRGNKRDPGVPVTVNDSTPRDETDSMKENQLPTISSMADLLVFYATWTGFVCYRNPITGSCFIRALCEELDTNSTDLSNMLKRVKRKISYSIDSENKQQAVTMDTLTKTLLFTKKTYGACVIPLELVV